MIGFKDQKDPPCPWGQTVCTKVGMNDEESVIDHLLDPLTLSDVITPKKLSNFNNRERENQMMEYFTD
ncbi:hypothetical protein C5167_004086 [Papaver somniferum]|nr:hypothetical protein C5167_004086 [Papaver somniferum]